MYKDVFAVVIDICRHSRHHCRHDSEFGPCHNFAPQPPAVAEQASAVADSYRGRAESGQNG